MVYGRRYGKVNISFYGNTTTLRSATLRQYLPELMVFAKDFPRNHTIPAEECLSIVENNHTALVLDIIFLYLQEVDSLGTSGYLPKALDDHWNRSRHQTNTTKQLFSHLGNVLSPGNFGCCSEIWNAMQQFLVRHSTEIVHGSPYNWISYIRALETALGGVRDNRGLDLASPLNIIVRKERLNSAKLAELASSGQLSHTSIDILYRLIYAKRPRRDQLRVKNPTWKTIGRQLSGTSIDPYELQLYCNRYPGAINVDLQKVRRLEELEDYRDDFDANDGDYSYHGDLISHYEDAGYYAPRYAGNPHQLEDAYSTMDYPGYGYGIVA